MISQSGTGCFKPNIINNQQEDDIKYSIYLIILGVLITGCSPKHTLTTSRDQPAADTVPGATLTDQDNTIVVTRDLGEGQELRIENPVELEEWRRRSKEDYEMIGIDFGIGTGLHVNPENIDLDASLPWDELAGLILWDFATVSKPGDEFVCHDGEAYFKRRIGSVLTYSDDVYIGGMDDMIVNEFVFRSDYAEIDGVVVIYYEMGDVYFEDIRSGFSDTEVMLRLAAVTAGEAEQAGFNLSGETLRALKPFR